MNVALLLLAGLIGGTLGGMGMGGGTLLIPLLCFMCNVSQHSAQAINLVTFIPMALVALAIHIKNKSVDFKGVLWIILPACAASVGFAFLSSAVKPAILTILFGVFLTCLGVVQLTLEIIGIVKAKRAGQREKPSS